jgi:hypothetical protein
VSLKKEKKLRKPARKFANPNGVAKTESPLPTASIGGAWYHDEAMKEEQKAQKH